MRILRGKWARSLVFGPARGPDRVAPIANDVVEVGRFVDDFEMTPAAPLACAPFFESRIVGGHVAPKAKTMPAASPLSSGAIASNGYIPIMRNARAFTNSRRTYSRILPTSHM